MNEGFDKISSESMARVDGLRERAALADGGLMPWLGLGLYQMGSDEETAAAVRSALALGYRHLDTAALYGNEVGVGKGLRTSGVRREDIFVTTKIWNDDIRGRRVRAAFEESQARLGLETVDLLLLHWPVDGLVEGWEALLALRESGVVRSVGVSNFMPEHLDALARAGLPPPVVNQIEFHPYLRSPALLEKCRRENIRLTAWSPLMQGGLSEDPVLRQIGAAHGKTAAQVVLRWDLQHGVATIPKTSRPERMRENAEIFDFALSAEEMAQLDALDGGRRSGADPYDFAF